MAGGCKPGEVLDPVVITIAVNVVDLNRKATAPTKAPEALRVEDADPEALPRPPVEATPPYAGLCHTSKPTARMTRSCSSWPK